MNICPGYLRKVFSYGWRRRIIRIPFLPECNREKYQKELQEMENRTSLPILFAKKHVSEPEFGDPPSLHRETIYSYYLLDRDAIVRRAIGPKGENGIYGTIGTVDLSSSLSLAGCDEKEIARKLKSSFEKICREPGGFCWLRVRDRLKELYP